MPRINIKEVKLVKQGPLTEELAQDILSIIVHRFYGKHSADYMAAFKAEMAKSKKASETFMET